MILRQVCHLGRESMKEGINIWVQANLEKSEPMLQSLEIRLSRRDEKICIFVFLEFKIIK